MIYQERKYRSLLHTDRLISFRVVVKETDLHVHATQRLEDVTRDLILKHRGYLENHIGRHPEFLHALEPVHLNGPAPLIVQDMVAAGQKAGVGPMAAVAGAIAEHVGVDLLSHSDEVIIENGGDVYMKTSGPIIVGVFAGKSPLSMRIGLRFDSGNRPLSICTSSGTIGHSLSYGKADAVCVVSVSCSLADAVATAVGNRVKSKTDIQAAIDFGKTIKDVIGLLVILGDAMGIWGELDLVPLKIEKG
jgi:ApbE superfamily uncharacterized protein (UPF0280 family)